jgi:periplasmic protein TonB
MKKLTLLATGLLFLNTCFTQTKVPPPPPPTPAATNDTTFTLVERESEFPGGAAAWQRFLNQNLVYPKKAIRKNIQGEVVLQFIVYKDGSVHDIEALSGPEELRKTAIDVLRQSPNWIPAQQFGRRVKAYKKQPIVFRLERG